MKNRYLIKFLAKVVENSDKTKMTSSNMGICFGVSLLSNNGPLNNKNNNHHKSETKVIDMATATNVFDFLLTNHHEIFAEDIDFSSNSTSHKKANSGSGNYSTLSKATGSYFSKDLNNDSSSQATLNMGSNSSFNNKYPESPIINKSTPIAKENNTEATINDQMNNTLFQRPTNTSSPMVGNNNNNNYNITHVNRTINKSSKNYFDSHNVDNNELFASNNSINSVGSVNNVNSFNNMNKSLSSPSQNSAE